MALLISSDNGWFCAAVEEVADGIAVAIFRKMSRGPAPWRRIHAELLDVPFHVACDRIHETVQQLRPEFDSTTPADKRRRVLSLMH